jgi:hypothetical protein
MARAQRPQTAPPTPRLRGQSAAEDLGGGRIWSGAHAAAARRPAHLHQRFFKPHCRPGKFFRWTGWRRSLRDLALERHPGTVFATWGEVSTWLSMPNLPASTLTGPLTPRTNARLSIRLRPTTMRDHRGAGEACGRAGEVIAVKRCDQLELKSTASEFDRLGALPFGQARAPEPR